VNFSGIRILKNVNDRTLPLNATLMRSKPERNTHFDVVEGTTKVVYRKPFYYSMDMGLFHRDNLLIFTTHK
jgi:hypothetical protein